MCIDVKNGVFTCDYGKHRLQLTLIKRQKQLSNWCVKQSYLVGYKIETSSGTLDFDKGYILEWEGDINICVQ
jgi:hypothetical protein